jgi:hypothetical protein
MIGARRAAASPPARRDRLAEIVLHIRERGRANLPALKKIQAELRRDGFDRSLVRIIDSVLWSSHPLLEEQRLRAASSRPESEGDHRTVHNADGATRPMGDAASRPPRLEPRCELICCGCKPRIGAQGSVLCSTRLC